MQAASNVSEHLHQATESSLRDAEMAVVMRYVQDLSQLVSLIRELFGYWETYLDHINQHNESTAHRASYFREKR